MPGVLRATTLSSANHPIDVLGGPPFEEKPDDGAKASKRGKMTCAFFAKKVASRQRFANSQEWFSLSRPAVWGLHRFFDWSRRKV